MKCNSCDAETRVLETREKQEHVVKRRHGCPNWHTFWTMQVLHTVSHAQRQWLESAIERAARGVARRRKEFAKRKAVEDMLREGHKWAVIEDVTGASESLIKKVKRSIRSSS